MMQAFGIDSRKWDLHSLNQSHPYWAQKELRYIVAGNPYVSDMKKKDFKKNHGFY